MAQQKTVRTRKIFSPRGLARLGLFALAGLMMTGCASKLPAPEPGTPTFMNFEVFKNEDLCPKYFESDKSINERNKNFQKEFRDALDEPEKSDPRMVIWAKAQELILSVKDPIVAAECTNLFFNLGTVYDLKYIEEIRAKQGISKGNHFFIHERIRERWKRHLR